MEDVEYQIGFSLLVSKIEQSDLFSNTNSLFIVLFKNWFTLLASTFTCLSRRGRKCFHFALRKETFPNERAPQHQVKKINGKSNFFFFFLPPVTRRQVNIVTKLLRQTIFFATKKR